MSFGFSIGDAILLTQLASQAVKNARKACGVHDEVTRELSSLHLVLGRLQNEAAKPESPINRPDDSCLKELKSIVAGCEKVLKVLENILVKYNALSKEERSGRRLWQRIRFGNGEMQNLVELRARLVCYTSAISLFLNMISMGSIGRVEKRMDEAGGDLREIRLAVNGITAHLLAGKDRESSVLTNYTEDDKSVWKAFRRELVAEGFSSSIIHQHKRLIKAYIQELASRGLLDEQDPYNEEVEATHEIIESGQDNLDIPSPKSNPIDGALEESAATKKNNDMHSESLSRTESPKDDIFAGYSTGVKPTAAIDEHQEDPDSHVGGSLLKHYENFLGTYNKETHRLGYKDNYPNSKSTFVAAPFGICVMAHGYNISLTWWHFRWRMSIIQECLAELTDIYPITTNMPGYIFQRLVRLRKTRDTAELIMSCSVLEDLVVYQSDFLNVFAWGLWNGKATRGILDELNKWILVYQIECPDILACVRQSSERFTQQIISRDAGSANQTNEASLGDLVATLYSIKLGTQKQSSKAGIYEKLKVFVMDAGEVIKSVVAGSIEVQPKVLSVYYDTKMAPTCREFLQLPRDHDEDYGVILTRLADWMECYVRILDSIELPGDRSLGSQRFDRLHKVLEMKDELADRINGEKYTSLYMRGIEKEVQNMGST